MFNANTKPPERFPSRIIFQWLSQIQSQSKCSRKNWIPSGRHYSSTFYLHSSKFLRPYFSCVCLIGVSYSIVLLCNSDCLLYMFFFSCLNPVWPFLGFPFNLDRLLCYNRCLINCCIHINKRDFKYNAETKKTRMCYQLLPNSYTLSPSVTHHHFIYHHHSFLLFMCTWLRQLAT